MTFPVKDALTQEEVQSGLQAVIKDGLASQAMATFAAQHWDFFFFLAFLIGLYSINRLAKVKEIGEVEEKIVIHELASEIRRPLRNLSSAGGLRQMLAFPISLLTHAPAINRPRGE